MKGKHLVILIAPLAGVSVLVAHFWGGPWSTMRWIGFAMILFGFAMWSVAHVQLGTSFSATAQARKLVTHGIYSKVRNPIYVFGSIALAGVCLFIEMPIILLAFLLLIPIQILRARKEAQVLENAFGEDYRAYRKNTWF